MAANDDTQDFEIPKDIIHGLVWERETEGCMFKFAMIVRKDFAWVASVLALPEGGVDEWICSGKGSSEQHAKTSAFDAMLAMCDAGETRLRLVSESKFDGDIGPYDIELFFACAIFAKMLRANQLPA